MQGAFLSRRVSDEEKGFEENRVGLEKREDCERR